LEEAIGGKGRTAGRGKEILFLGAKPNNLAGERGIWA